MATVKGIARNDKAKTTEDGQVSVAILSNDVVPAGWMLGRINGVGVSTGGLKM